MMQTHETLSLPLIADHSEKPQEEESSSQQQCTSLTEIVLALAVPALLFAQFYIITPEGDDETDVDHMTINISSAIFFLASVMYRSVLSEHIDTPMMILLLPEIACLLTIALVWIYQQAFAGFLCMSFGTIIMSLTVAWNSASTLLSESSRISLFGFLMTLALPALIYAQYCILLIGQSDMQGLTSVVAQAAVAGFLVVSLMFRKILEDKQIVSTTVHLIPELVGVSTILLFANGAVAAGFYCLVISEGILAIAIAAVCVRQLWQHERATESVEETTSSTKVLEV